jgi:hypothetical protein
VLNWVYCLKKSNRKNISMKYLICLLLVMMMGDAFSQSNFPSIRCSGNGFNLSLMEDVGILVKGNMDGMGIKGAFSSNPSSYNITGWFEPTPSVASETAVILQIFRSDGAISGEITVRYRSGQITKKTLSGICQPASSKPIF